ncbi:MAG TPA: hypothetical protein VJ827_04900 [Rubrobacter sp.]|nr:hypothetical protein [Rubrobacter sp.]
MGRRSSTLESVPVTNRVRASWHWLIVKNTASEMEILTLEAGGSHRTLPVFGSKKAAMKMLPASGGWRVRKTGGGELISILCGPCTDATRVAFDPSPELVEEKDEMVSESTDGYLDLLMGRGRAWFDESPGGAH